MPKTHCVKFRTLECEGLLGLVVAFLLRGLSRALWGLHYRGPKDLINTRILHSGSKCLRVFLWAPAGFWWGLFYGTPMLYMVQNWCVLGSRLGAHTRPHRKTLRSRANAAASALSLPGILFDYRSILIYYIPILLYHISTLLTTYIQSMASLAKFLNGSPASAPEALSLEVVEAFEKWRVAGSRGGEAVSS